MAKSPGFVAVVTLTLPLGIATNVSIFAVTKSMILDALPYEEADRLTYVWESRPARGWTDVSLSAANYADWTERQPSFESMALYDFVGFNMSTEGDAERSDGVRTTVNLFDVTGRSPLLGRSFTTEDVESEEPVVILSHALWNESFGLDPAILGTKVLLDGNPHTVIGVLPAEAAFPPSARLRVPSDFAEERESRGNRSYPAPGRFAEGMTAEATHTDMECVAAELEAEFPDENAG